MKKKRVIKIGKVNIGGSFPVAIQGMIKNPYSRKDKVLEEAKLLKQEGCDILRLAIEKEDDVRFIGLLKENAPMALEADVHFDHRLALLSLEKGIDALRLNPLNITDPKKITEVARLAKLKNIPIRVGINSGGIRRKLSEERLARKLAEAVLSYVKIIEKQGFRQLVLSVKTHSVSSTVLANQILSEATDYPLTLGLTATGSFREGLIKSCVGLGVLLWNGIGNALRVSLNSDSREEIKMAKLILQSLGLGDFYSQVISCPTCSRCKVDLQDKVEKFQELLYRDKGKLYNKNIKVALMGCAVNGPGEAAAADIGIAFGKDFGVLFKKGKIVKRIRQDDYIKEILSSAGKDK